MNFKGLKYEGFCQINDKVTYVYALDNLIITKYMLMYKQQIINVSKCIQQTVPTSYMKTPRNCAVIYSDCENIKCIFVWQL